MKTSATETSNEIPKDFATTCTLIALGNKADPLIPPKTHKNTTNDVGIENTSDSMNASLPL